EKLIEKLRLGGYPVNTPVVVVERASWPEQRIVRGSVSDIAAKVAEEGIKKTALIFVGESLRASSENTGKESKLYHKDFKHGYRK
ncbi:MAG: hypothetical protein KAR83_07955, partial [Thermodesulfovibrionales bacterium]|nr:hypothetical protein [Thermodesulfovibrionales bacterium]